MTLFSVGQAVRTHFFDDGSKPNIAGGEPIDILINTMPTPDSCIALFNVSNTTRPENLTNKLKIENSTCDLPNNQGINIYKIVEYLKNMNRASFSYFV